MHIPAVSKYHEFIGCSFHDFVLESYVKKSDLKNYISASFGAYPYMKGNMHATKSLSSLSATDLVKGQKAINKLSPSSFTV